MEVHLAATRTTPELSFRARVARGRRVPPQLLAAAGGGLGLRVIDPPPGFAQLVAGDDDITPSPARTAASAAPKGPAQRSFQVRLQATGGMRSRSVTVQSSDAKTAGAQACALVGSGWEVVGVSEQS